MSGSHQPSPPSLARNIQPPRPPNAWILFRSDMSRKLPPPQAGAPARPQAAISKAISEMWANADPTIKAEYERRAETKKAEHQARYPNYRFTPMKKEERDRIREEKRLEKEREKERGQTRRGRGRATATPYYSPSIPMRAPVMPMYPPAPVFGSYGPSPPLYAAASPNDATVQYSAGEGSGLTDAFPSQNTGSLSTTLPDNQGSAQTVEPQTPSGIQPAASLDPPIENPTPRQWPSAGEHSTPESAAPTPHSAQWTEFGASHTETTAPPTPVSDMLMFNIPHIAAQDWSEPSEFDSSMQAFLSATGDPSIFEMSNFDPHSLVANPTGEIELFYEGYSGLPDSLLSQADFSSYNFGAFPGSSQPTDAALSALFTPTNNPPPSHYDFLDDQFINYDADRTLHSEEPLTPVTPIPPVPQQLEHPTPYVPPPGAAYSSNRRAGGSWKTSFVAAEAGIDSSPSRQWGVPAN